MSEETRYVDVDKFKAALMGIYPASYSNYSHSPLESQINGLISQVVSQVLDSFKHQMIVAIDKAAVPYDKCMLCVKRDSCIPPHPLGDNR